VDRGRWSGPSAARLRGIRAGSAYDARGRISHNPPVVGSSPTLPTRSYSNSRSDRGLDRGSIPMVWSFVVSWLVPRADTKTNRQVGPGAPRCGPKPAGSQAGRSVPQDRAGRADRARQAARDGPGRAAARLGRHRGPAARPVHVNSRVGHVHSGKQPRLYPPDHQTRPRVYAGPQGPRPAAAHAVRPTDAMRQPRVHRQALHRASQHPGPAVRPDRPPTRMGAGCGPYTGSDRLWATGRW
jgi:hypothetical protein